MPLAASSMSRRWFSFTCCRLLGRDLRQLRRCGRGRGIRRESPLDEEVGDRDVNVEGMFFGHPLPPIGEYA